MRKNPMFSSCPRHAASRYKWAGCSHESFLCNVGATSHYGARAQRTAPHSKAPCQYNPTRNGAALLGGTIPTPCRHPSVRSGLRRPRASTQTSFRPKASATSTVAILAQGTSWAVAVTQAFFVQRWCHQSAPPVCTASGGTHQHAVHTRFYIQLCSRARQPALRTARRQPSSCKHRARGLYPFWASKWVA